MFTNQNLELIGEQLDGLFTIKELGTDPILGEDPPELSILKNFPKRHGNMIEHLLLSLMDQTRIWESYHHTASEFHFVKSLTAEETNGALLIDTLSINQKLEIALFIESKRDLDQQPHASKVKMKAYKDWCIHNAKEILTEIGIPDGECRFAIFDAYGPKFGSKYLNDIPVLRPKDLRIFFPSFVVNLFALIEHCVITKAKEHLNINLDSLPTPHISKNYGFNFHLEEIEWQLREFFVQNDRSDADDSLSYSDQQTFLRELENLQLGLQ